MTPKCPNCKGHSFQLSEESVEKGTFPILFISCKSCGTIVGTSTYHHMQVELERQVKVILSQIKPPR